jgi:hypothetical protein
MIPLYCIVDRKPIPEERARRGAKTCDKECQRVFRRAFLLDRKERYRKAAQDYHPRQNPPVVKGTVFPRLSTLPALWLQRSRSTQPFHIYRPQVEGVGNHFGAISLGAHALGRRDHHAPAHDHGSANGRCRGPRGPNALRAIPSLRDSGRNADVSSMPLQTEDAPNVPGPTCNGGSMAPNIRLSKRSPRLGAAQAPHKRSPVADSRCTPKSALNSARR